MAGDVEVVEIEIDESKEYRNAFDDDDEDASKPPTDEESPTDEVESEDAEPEEEEAPPPVPTEPAPAAPATKEAPPVEAPASAAPAEKPAEQEAAPAEPFKFKVDRKEIAIPGSVVFEAETANGKEQFITFPLSEFQRTLHPHLADRSLWRNEKKQLLQELAKRDPETHPDVVKSREVLKLFQKLIGSDDGAVLNTLDEWRANLPTWQSQQETVALKKQLEAVNAVEAPPDEALQQIETEEFNEQLRDNLKGHLATLAKLPEFAGLIDVDDILPDIWDVRQQVYFTIDEDGQLPNGKPVRKGDLGINFGYLKEKLSREATRLKTARERVEKAKQVEAQNAAVLKETPQPKPTNETSRRHRPKKETYAQIRERFLADVSGPVITE